MRLYKILLCIRIVLNVGIIATHAEWFQSLINYIQVDSRKYQVFLITDSDKQNLRTNLVFKIPTIFPTQMVNFSCVQNAESNCLENHQFLEDYRRTNLFIIVPSTNSSETVNKTIVAIDVLIRLSKGRTLPKCLLILPMEENKYSYKKLLRNLWTQRVLDATILEFEQKLTSGNYFTERMNEKILKIIQYNPFMKRNNFYNRKLPTKIEFFPNKLKNLHLWQFKAGLVTKYPTANVKRNNTGHIIQLTGTDANLLNFMAKAMNFSIKIVQHNYTYYGTFNKYGNQSDGLTRMLENNTLNLLANTIFGTESVYRTWSEFSRGIDYTTLQAVVPIRYQRIPHTIITGRMLTTMGICAIMIISLLFLAGILKLEKSVWRPLALLQILFGFVVVHEPKQNADRIIFAVILFTSMILSMNVYEVFTDQGMNSKIEIEINTLDDLLKSELKPKISASLKIAIIYNTIDEFTLNAILNKSESIPFNKHVDCLDELTNYRNVCCILNAQTIEYAFQEYVPKSGQPIMKTVPELLRFTWLYLYFEKGSPFLPEFNRLLLLLQESGIQSKLKEKPKRLLVDHQVDEGETQKISDAIRFFFLVFLVVDGLILVVFFLTELCISSPSSFQINKEVVHSKLCSIKKRLQIQFQWKKK